MAVSIIGGSAKSSNTGSSTSMTTPSGTAVGDLMILSLCADSGTLSGIAAPDGTWTQLFAQSITNGNGKAWWKVATASGAQSFTLPSPGTDSDPAATLIVLRGQASGAPTAVVSSSNTSSTSHVAPTATGVTDGALVGFFQAISTSNSVRSYTPPSGMTEYGDTSVSALSMFTASEVAGQLLTSDAATGTKTATCSASTAWIAVSVVVSPAGGPTTYAAASAMSSGSSMSAAATVSGGGGGGGGGTVTLTAGTPFEATASVTSGVVSLPASLAAGDFTFLFCTINGTSGVITAPAGYSTALASVSSTASTSHAVAIYYKAWVSGDGNPTVTCTSGRLAVLPVRVQGANTTTPYESLSSTTQAAATTSVDAPSATASAATLLVSVFSGRSSSTGVFIGWTPPSGMTEVGETTGQAPTQTNASLSVNTLAITAGSTGTKIATADSTATGSRGVTILFVAAAATGVQKTITASLTVTSVTDHSTFKRPVGNVTPAGAYTRAGFTRTLIGSTTPAGVKIASLPRRLFGAIFTTGTTQRGYPRTVTGSLTPLGTVAKQSAGRFFFATINAAGAAKRAVTHNSLGSSSPAGVTVKAPQTKKLGTITGSGVPNQLGVRFRAFTASITGTATLKRGGVKRPAGSVTPSGAPIKRATTKRPKGTISTVGALAVVLFRRVFGRSGTASVVVSESAEVDMILYQRHRCQMTIETVADATTTAGKGQH